jgi:hypothetical protein
MNENDEIDFLGLEAELSILRPAGVSPALLEKIEHSLANTQTGAFPAAIPDTRANRVNANAFFARNGRFGQYGQLAAAALLVVSSGLLFMISRGGPAVSQAPEDAKSIRPVYSGTPAPGAIGDDFHRVGNSSQVTAPNDAGVVIKEGKPYHVWRFDFQEEQQWKNPKDGSSVRVKRPQKEQMLIPLPVF